MWENFGGKNWFQLLKYEALVFGTAKTLHTVKQMLNTALSYSFTASFTTGFHDMLHY